MKLLLVNQKVTSFLILSHFYDQIQISFPFSTKIKIFSRVQSTLQINRLLYYLLVELRTRWLAMELRMMELRTKELRTMGPSKRRLAKLPSKLLGNLGMMVLQTEEELRPVKNCMRNFITYQNLYFLLF